MDSDDVGVFISFQHWRWRWQNRGENVDGMPYIWCSYLNPKPFWLNYPVLFDL